MRVILQFFIATFLVFGGRAETAVLQGSEKLEWEGDLSARMVEGISRFLDRETEQAKAERAKFWSREPANAEAYSKSVEENRENLRRMIGGVDPRVEIENIEFLSTTQAEAKVAETEAYGIHAVRWPVLEGVHGEGLWLRPKQPTGAWVIALPDADQTPEMLSGLEMGIGHDQQFARRLAEAGCEVFVPVLVNRGDRFSGNSELNRFTNQPHREWIYRQGYELGRHIIGYEVWKVLALVDWIKNHAPRVGESPRVGVAGYGEGGLIALYAAALDERIDSALVSGYFGPRERLWQEPIYRNVFGLLREFGDAEIASLIWPRALVVEYSHHPEVDGPPPRREGRSGAAPGLIRTPERYLVEDEFNRALDLVPTSPRAEFHFVYGNEGNVIGPGSNRALEEFCRGLRVSNSFLEGGTVLPEAIHRMDAAERQKRQVKELEAFTQGVLLRSERARENDFWRQTRGLTSEEWPEKSAEFKKILWEEVLGKFENPLREPRPRARKIYDEPKWTGFEVVLDVWPDVFAWGVLLVPRDLEEGERRPVVVCQHGLEGVPADTIEEEGTGYRAYKAFAARLAERGFITFAPHNPYRGQDKFRVLQRKANPLGRSLFSVILGQHEQILNWLGSLEIADPARIAFYGLSYGGKTAMRVPPLLDGYCLSICSADFNEWVKKNATVHSPYSYMFTGEYEMPEWNLGHTFNYAEMAALIAPRPFMVERGHDDGVAPDEWVAHEYAKVRRHYAKLGIPERTEIEFFDGPHTIHGVGTFEFLAKHLNWPPAEETAP